MSDWFAQEPHGVRFDWGPAGARRLAPASACLVIVDVLSFSTAVTVADVAAALAGSASGRELSQRGCAADIAIAAEIDTCGVAAVLVNGAFEAAGRAAR
jgi:phosphosulfolactate phosphohydrolase-like enzyme